MSAPTAAATEALVIRNLVNLRLLKSRKSLTFRLGDVGESGNPMVDIRDSDPDNVGNFKALGRGIPQEPQGTFTGRTGPRVHPNHSAAVLEGFV